MDACNGPDLGLTNLSRLSTARTRSISPENRNGGKGEGGRSTDGTGARFARDLGVGWKISPSLVVGPGERIDIADAEGEGVIQHIWMTPTGRWRNTILRFHWDGSPSPSVECPIGDFFACGWGEFAPLVSQAVCVNPGSAFNCYWPMPFRKGFRIEVENRDDEPMVLFYQIDFALTDVPGDAAYFHAQFRRSNPLPYAVPHTILDGVRGAGQYVGTYLAWGSNSDGWWGEGEVKFYLDGDEWPTICGTGTEDYFCGSYNFEDKRIRQYREFCTPYAGLPQVLRPDGVYRSQQRFGLYRWHIPDPIRFASDLRVTVQALGWRSGERYLPLRDDIASTAFWYQTLPAAPFPPLGSRDDLEVV